MDKPDESDTDQSLLNFMGESYISTDITNTIVVGLMITIMVAYVFTYIGVAYLERRKIPLGSLYMPEDNMARKNNFYYVIMVSTGMRPGAGLDESGTVQLTLHGTQGTSQPMMIRNVDRGVSLVFQRGTSNRLLLPTPALLGDLEKIDVEVYSLKQKKLNWYLKYIRVTDVRYWKHTDFIFDRCMRTSDHLKTSVPISTMTPLRRFFERFMSIYLDLSIWTSVWTQSCETSAFSRSLHVSFCMMTFALLMAANLLVCLIPVIHKRRVGAPLPNQNMLIHEALALGSVANILVLFIQYTFELLLRHVRTATCQYLTICGKNIWTNKGGMHDSIVPMYPGNPYRDSDIIGDRITTPLLSRDELKSSSKKYDTTAPTSIPTDNTYSNERMRIKQEPSDYSEKALCKRCSSKLNSPPLTPSKIVPGASKEELKGMVNKTLWDEKNGIMSKYVADREGPGGSQNIEDKLDYKKLAHYIVNIVMEESKKTILENQKANKSDAVTSIQEEIFQALQVKCAKKSDDADIIDRLRKSGSDKLGSPVHEHKSEGHLGDQLSRKSSDHNTSFTSSCPEVAGKGVPQESDHYGPVINRLSESIKGIAVRNSLSFLQQNATDEVAKQNRAVSKHDRMNTKTLMDSISQDRAERLTEKSMKYIAKASLSSLVSEEALRELQKNAADSNQKAMQAFTMEVVNNLYNIVYAKLEDLIAAHDSELTSAEDKERQKKISNLVKSADEEIKSSVLPPLEEYIQAMLTDQAHSFLDTDVDLVMMAFSGQYVDTIVTNAVLQTHVKLLQAKNALAQGKIKNSSSNNNMNVNNNMPDEPKVTTEEEDLHGLAIGKALSTVTEITDVQSVMAQLCMYMMTSYRQKKGCTMEHTPEINEAMETSFIETATERNAFERILSEAIKYLHAMSKHCDMASIQGNSKLMSRLSETFLTSGFDVDLHAGIAEDLSSNFLHKAMHYACAVVAEQLIGYYLSKEMLGDLPPYSMSSPDILKNSYIELPVGSLHAMSAEEISCYFENNQTSSNEEITSYLRNIPIIPVPVRRRGNEFYGPTHKFVPLNMVMAGENDPDQNYGFSNSPRTRGSRQDVRNSTPNARSSIPNERGNIPNAQGSIPNIRSTGSIYGRANGTAGLANIANARNSSVRGGSGQNQFQDSKQPPGSEPKLPQGDESLVYMPANNTLGSGQDPQAEGDLLWHLALERDVTGESSKCLPNFTIHFLQVFVMVFTVASLSICMLFGLQLPNASAVAWLVALLCGLIQHVVLWETLKVMAVALYYVNYFDNEV